MTPVADKCVEVVLDQNFNISWQENLRTSAKNKRNYHGQNKTNKLYAALVPEQVVGDTLTASLFPVQATIAQSAGVRGWSVKAFVLIFGFACIFSHTVILGTYALIHVRR